MSRRPCFKKAVIAIATIAMLASPLLEPFASAGTVWNEGPVEFAAGTKESLGLGPNGLSLGGVNGTAINQWARRAFGDPARRYGSATAYDIVHDEVVMFGGEGMPGALGDTWAYNISRNNWTNRNPSVSPPARYGHAMVYDIAHGQVVLFGGVNDSYLGDTWTYDPGTNAWANQSPSYSPPARYEHAMAFDSARGKVVMFGGYAGATLYNDTWAYDPGANTWTNISTSSAPSPRYFHAMAYDGASDKVVLFGGYHGILPAMGDTWAFNPGSNTWTEMSPPTAPAGRYSHTMACDSRGGGVVIFGGYLGTWPLLGDTWRYNYTSGTWTDRNPSGAPSARYEQTMAYDSLRGLMVMFGGLNSTYMADTWTYDPGANDWTDRAPATAPAARCDHAMAYDSAHDKVVLFGGFDGYDYLNDTWAYDLRTGIWTNMSPPAAPPARRYHAMAYDTVNGRTVIFGGYNGSSIGDTWAYDLGGNIWTNMSPPLSPQPRDRHAMVYDIARGEVLMAGGRGLVYDNGTWTYNLTTNTWTGRSLQAWGTTMHAMAYDPVHGVTVMFGGGMDFGNKTFTYDPGTGNWTEMRPATSPPGRYGHAMAYDRAAGGIVLFGGFGYARILKDTWRYDLDAEDWAAMDPPSSPPARWSAAMVFDSSRGGTVLFGGLGDNYFSDTWEYDQLTVSPSGTYTSAPRDAGGQAYFGALSWNASVPAGTTIRFQFRSAPGRLDLLATAFVGPDGTSGTYYTASGQPLNAAHNGSRWLQYRAFFDTSDPGSTPVLRKVTVDYNLLHSVEVVLPRPGDIWSGVRTISWNASDPDNDALYFDIVLIDSKGQPSLLASNLTGRSWQWNTSLFPEGACKLRITARDGHPTIPLSAVAESGAFLVTLAAANRLPSANLVSPANMSTVISGNLTLIWNGSDPDNDPVWYNLTWACGTFDRPDRPFIITQNISYALTGLANATTWFWAVTPYDGKDDGPRTPVWQFTVNISGMVPPNHPPLITSAPAVLAATDVLYVYNVVATDPDNDNITFSLEGPPAGMAIGNMSGTLAWTPSAAGNYSIAVKATDLHGASDIQRFTLQVLAPGPRPVCIITNPPDGATISGTINITGFAVRGATPLDRVEVRIDGGNWQEVSGLDNWRIILHSTDLPNGRHLIEARAACGLNYSDIAKAQMTVKNDSPGPRPYDAGLSIDPLPCLTLILVLMLSFLFTAVYITYKGRAALPPGRAPAPPRRSP